eukprot:4286169-Amphidinium_carterae.1
MPCAHEDLQTLKARRESGMVPAYIAGTTCDASVEVHLFRTSVAVNAKRAKCLNRREGLTTESFQPRDASAPPIAPEIGVVCIPLRSRRDAWRSSGREHVWAGESS